jgi:ABC-type branched-subunit amino acid transport system substrate-binding protein
MDKLRKPLLNSSRCVRWMIFLILGLFISACSQPEPLRIAVMMPLNTSSPDPMMGMESTGASLSSDPSITWALENVNAAGGVAGRQIALDYYDISSGNHVEMATQLVADERYVAVIGPGGSQALSDVADLFVDKKKPLVSFTSASADLLRAYGGKGAIWRMRQSDIAQTELLVRFAQEQGAVRVGLLTSLDAAGASFFSWFGFFAKEHGIPDSRVKITTMDDVSCAMALSAALADSPDMLFVAGGSVQQLSCVAQGFAMLTGAHPRVVLADTGFDPSSLGMGMGMGMGALNGLEGFSASGDKAYEQAFLAHTGKNSVAPHGAASYDAVLLLAYGLQAAQGQGGAALIDAIKSVVDGREASQGRWDADGIKASLVAIRDGERPQLVGATGLLKFEPELYMDLVSSTLSHWQISGSGLAYDSRYSTAEGGFLTSRGALVPASAGLQGAVQSSTYMPAAAKGDLWALIAAFSSGWSNYRHQADALRQYQLLRANGVDDAHIVLILADDLAQATQNSKKGTVRNVPDGQSLYQNVAIDYGLTVTATDLQNILTGQVTVTTPKVLSLTAGSNLYVYLAGHGGTSGMPLGATTALAGVSGTGSTTVLSPTHLREALCTLQTQGRLRRSLVVIESCFSGAFGETAYDGLESGCGVTGSRVPLLGTALLTAANSREVSYAGGYDSALRSWVNDAFSNQFAQKAMSAPTASLVDAYTEVYLHVSGSHTSLYNSANAGRLAAVTLTEFLRP